MESGTAAFPQVTADACMDHVRIDMSCCMAAARPQEAPSGGQQDACTNISRLICQDYEGHFAGVRPAAANLPVGRVCPCSRQGWAPPRCTSAAEGRLPLRITVAGSNSDAHGSASALTGRRLTGWAAAGWGRTYCRPERTASWRCRDPTAPPKPSTVPPRTAWLDRRRPRRAPESLLDRKLAPKRLPAAIYKFCRWHCGKAAE